jgi:hypothetical protein
MGIQRYSLDKKAPGMFEHAHGGWVKYKDHLAVVQGEPLPARPGARHPDAPDTGPGALDETPQVHLGPWALNCGTTWEFWGPFKTVDEAWHHLFGRKSSSYEREVFMDAEWSVIPWMGSGAENLRHIARSRHIDATDPRCLIPEDRVPDGPKVVDDGGPVKVIDPAGPGQKPPPGSPGVLE